MSAKRIVYYHCPFCNKEHLTKEKLVNHITDKHEDVLPEEFTPLRYTFNYINRKPIDYHGVCTECKRPTPWDENAGRYKRQCGRKECHDSFVRKFEDNMIRTKGMKRISQSAEGQEKMLAHRKISGTYKFRNGVEKTYTGSYELQALKFMDQVMHIDPNDLMCPGPVLEYNLRGQKHIYITDFYYQPYNLIIEVKDGGNNPNRRSMPETRARQIEKEKWVIRNTNYNYLRLTNNDLSQLLSVFADLKMHLVENNGERVIHVNEVMNALMSAPPVGIDEPGSVYVINYVRKNAFSGEDSEGHAVADDIRFDKIIARNKQGKLDETDKTFLEDADYNIYVIRGVKEETYGKIRSNIGNFVEEGFIYETLFGKKFYTYDQIQTESSVISVMDYYHKLNLIEEVVKNYLEPNQNTYTTYDENGYENIKFQRCLETGKYAIRSKVEENLFLESDKPFEIDSDAYKFLDSISSRKGTRTDGQI